MLTATEKDLFNKIIILQEEMLEISKQLMTKKICKVLIARKRWNENCCLLCTSKPKTCGNRKKAEAKADR